ncbi:hypothetical protein GYB59_07695 [bacterium]|nr:hypothetical protein [bacterium]
MPFWNTTKIRQECQSHGMITPYREERAIRCAYELGVGSESYITSATESNTRLEEGEKVTIPPGQFGLLTTREIIYVPNHAIAFISIRASIKFQGLINVSGFHVDPGFRGPLKFAVYNAGSRDIDVDQDERVFMIWFADLTEDTPDPYGPLPTSTNIITAKDLGRLKGEVASPGELKKQMEEMKTELEKKIHAVEQTKLFNRSILFAILTALLMLYLTSFIKPYFDETGKSSAQAATTPAAATGADPSAVSRAFITMPAHLGFYILGGGGLAGLGAIAAAWIIRQRPR